VGSWVRIPLRVWTFVSPVCCVNSDLCDELITGSKDSYSMCDLETSKMRRPNYELRAIKLGKKGSSSATGV